MAKAFIFTSIGEKVSPLNLILVHHVYQTWP